MSLPSFSSRFLLLFSATLLLSACDHSASHTDQAPTAAADPHAPAPTAAAPSTAPAAPATTATTAPAADSTLLISPGRVGPYRIGMRVGELRRLAGPQLRNVTLRQDEADFPAFAIGHVGTSPLPELLLEPQCADGDDNPDGSVSDHCRIWRITVRDPRYHTAQGVGVRSKYQAVRLTAPIAYVGPTPMGIAATSEDWQINFLLDPKPILASRLPLRKETVHDTVRVTGVQLF